MTERIDWRDAEPYALEREHAAMLERAPDMQWSERLPAGGWEGRAPAWPAGCDAPVGLDRLLGEQRLGLSVQYTQGFPMAAPDVFPTDPIPPASRRADHSWHLNGNGSLCLLFSSADWPEGATAAELVEKASGWFVEYLAREAGLIERMSESGPVKGNLELEAALADL